MDQEVIRTQALEIVDSAGRLRGSLGINVDDGVSLSLLDQHGRAAIVLCTDPEGFPKFILSDPNDMPRLAAIVTSDGPRVSLFAEDRDAAALQLWTLPDGSSSVFILGDGDGQDVSVSCGPDGSASISMGTRSAQSVGISADREGLPALFLYDKEGEARVCVNVTKEGVPVVGWWDRDGELHTIDPDALQSG